MEEFKLELESERERKYHEERIEEQKMIVQEKTSELTKSHKEELKIIKQEVVQFIRVAEPNKYGQILM
jgi:hypothetical protein